MKWYETAGVRNVVKPFIYTGKDVYTLEKPHAT